jgi:hypothetical protein
LIIEQHFSNSDLNNQNPDRVFKFVVTEFSKYIIKSGYLQLRHKTTKPAMSATEATRSSQRKTKEKLRVPPR